MKKIEIESWYRKDQYNFFLDYDNPFFNICSEVDATKLYKFAKEHNLSFFISMLYAVVKAANETEEFRYRIMDESVVIYDTIHTGSTILNEDNSFSFCYFAYSESFEEFYENAENVLKRNRENKPVLEPRANESDLLHVSVLPLTTFSSISHPRKFRGGDSVPKIVLGKYHMVHGERKLPISIEVHHSLMDGFHLAKYLTNLQNILDNPDIL